MKLSQLEYFRAISEHGSITKTSKYLHITQPTLSKSMQDLEAEVGFELFYRSKNGIVLTSHGEAYLKQVKIVLREIDKLATIGANTPAKFRVGIPPTIGHCYIPQISSVIAQQNPPIEVEWKEGGTSTLERWLHAGEIDIAVVPERLIDIKEVNYVSFATMEEMLCVSENSPLTKEKFITVEMLADTRFALFSEQYNQNVSFAEVFGDSGFYPKDSIYTSQLSTMLELIEKNVAVAILISEISSLKRGNHKIVTIPLEPPYTFDLVVAWGKEHKQRSLREFVSLICSAVKE